IMGGGSLSLGGAGSLLRMLRLLRLSRLAKMLKSMPELMILIKGMAAAARSVFFTLALLVIVMYIFAIIFTLLASGTPSGEVYFRTIPDSMYTLLVAGVFLDDLAAVTTDIGQDSLVFPAIFFLFVLVGALTIMNMLIGVLCEVVSGVAAAEKEDMIVNFVKSKMQEVVDKLDTDGDQMISRAEFNQIMSQQEAVRVLHECGVDPEGLVDFADFIFAAEAPAEEDDDDDDEEEKEKELSLEEFLAIVLQFRGSNMATVKDIVDLRKFVNTSFTTFETKVSKHLQLVQAGATVPAGS
ncbi:unnamed protein product, partial [Polarella glacialis]